MSFGTDFRLVSGVRVLVDLAKVTCAGHVRGAIGHALAVPVGCVRLISSDGTELGDDVGITEAGVGVTMVVLDIGVLERLFREACNVERLMDLVGTVSLRIQPVRLMVLPDIFDQLAHLQEFSFDSNQVTVLPESLGQLTQLRRLYFNNNQVTVLPESLGQLMQLEMLSFKNNGITALPERLRLRV